MKRPILLPIGFLLFAVLGCDRSDNTQLKGQANTTFIFHGLAIDQDGVPLEGAKFEFVVESFPADWTFKTRGQGNQLRTISTVSDHLGRFMVEATGHVIRRERVERAGYRHFCDFDDGQWSDGRGGLQETSNYSFMIISWGDLCYRNSPERPTIFVLVKDGVREVAALPSRGGESSGNGAHWRKNEPGWPREPSLKDVVRKMPTNTTTP